MAALKQTCIESLRHWRKQESDCWAEQAVRGKDDDDDSPFVDDDGERVTFGAYRKLLRQREQRFEIERLRRLRLAHRHSDRH